MLYIQRRKWQPTPVLLPGKSHGRRSLVGYSPWGRKELDTTEQLHFTHFILSHWRRKWQPTPVFLPGESHGKRSLAGHGPWSRRESDMTEVTKHTRTPYIHQVNSTVVNVLLYLLYDIYSFQFSHSVVSDCLRPHESQHIRPPCPSPTPGVHSDSRPSSQ